MILGITVRDLPWRGEGDAPEDVGREIADLQLFILIKPGKGV